MTIKELLEKLDNMGDEREKPLAGLAKKLSPVSASTLLNFQNEWDVSKTFEEFKIEQNKIFKECVALEISDIGKIVRGHFSLPDLHMDSEL